MSEKIAQKITDLIGHTPLLELKNIEKKYGVSARLVAKLEYLNPAGSVKDRIAKSMIDEALASGQMTKDSVIIEPTSGNTGIGLCSVAASYGIRCIIVMPDTMSIERQKLMKAFGAEVVLSDGKLGMKGAIEKAESLAAANTGSFIPGQFTNPVNPLTHQQTTGPEIWTDTNGHVDAFIAGVGTGGTLSGTGTYLKSQNPRIKIIAVEPASSPLLSHGVAGPHKLQGIGANFIPAILDTHIYDEVIPVTDENAYAVTRDIARKEGFLAGISSGAALWAGIELGKRPEYKGKTIVVLLPDTGDRYLSTPDLF